MILYKTIARRRLTSSFSLKLKKTTILGHSSLLTSEFWNVIYRTRQVLNIVNR